MYKFWLIAFILLVFSACSTAETQKTLKVEDIIQAAIDSSGTERFQKAIVQFQFRDKTYRSIPTCDGLKLQREFSTDSATIKDELYQGDLSRLVNNEYTKVKDSLAFLYAESINSVHYFVQLPFRLKDEAAQKELVGTEDVQQKSYYKIRVSFQKDGGGEDFEDVYYYWIDTKNFEIAYLAYSFQVNGGGIRFRKVVSQKEINGIQFIDYDNYKPNIENPKLENSLNEFLEGKYALLSSIENTAILVNDAELHCE